MDDSIKTVQAKDLYDAFKTWNEKKYLKRMQISGIATFVWPDVYWLPSVELSEKKDVSWRVLCVLPFRDYLKLRKVSKWNDVIMEWNILWFADRYDIVVVKECKIVEVK